MRGLFAHLKSEFVAEWRTWPQTIALVLFIFVIAYVVYRIHPELSLQNFNLVFWIVFTMVSVNVAIKGTNHFGPGERIFLYQLVDPITAFISKLIFNFLFLLIIGHCFYLVVLLLFYPEITWVGGFSILLVIGAVCLSSVLSFVSAISRHLSGQNTALSIMSIPLLIPVIIILHNIGENMLVNNPIAMGKYIALIGISLLSISLSIILYPYLWRE